ncbi:MAG: sialidase family protein [Clostridiaceae bacterium]|nr:sialidase family protein [Clostridiaceae bacterium]
MSVEKFIVSRDDSVYEAWPDVVLTKSGKLICVFTECVHHGDRTDSRLALCESSDRGRTWSPKKYLTEKTSKDDHWNSARITRLRDDTLVIVCDRARETSNEAQAVNFMWKSHDDGHTWEEPIWTPADGIVPDKLLELSCGRWILTTHKFGAETGKLEISLIYSDDQGRSWSSKVKVAGDPRYNLCEASILETKSGDLVAFIRENSWKGLDCMKAISHDQGLTWDGVYTMPIPACHRPVSGYLQSGEIMITYRFMQGGHGSFGLFTQNFFAALIDDASALSTNRSEQSVRIMPIDYDRSPVSDLGYSGWVQFEDGEIYIVNYIVDDAPKAHIRGYSLKKSDFIL